MKLMLLSGAKTSDPGYGFSPLYQLFTLLFKSYLRYTVYLDEKGIEDGLQVKDILSLSCVSHSIKRYFDNFIGKYIRDEYEGIRFISSAKCLQALQSPELTHLHRDKLHVYFLERHPNIWKRYLVPHKNTIPTMQSFWQRGYHFSTGYDREASNSLDVWILRHGYRFDNKWLSSEYEFQLMIASSLVQVNSIALVVATLNEFSPYTFHLIKKRLGTTYDAVDYQDIVATLSIPWYEPTMMYELLERYPIFTDEMIWNIVSKGKVAQNELLLRMVLEKIYVPDTIWTFSFAPLNRINHSVTDIRSSDEFKHLLIRRAKSQGFSRKTVSFLRKRID